MSSVWYNCVFYVSAFFCICWSCLPFLLLCVSKMQQFRRNLQDRVFYLITDSNAQVPFCLWFWHWVAKGSSRICNYLYCLPKCSRSLHIFRLKLVQLTPSPLPFWEYFQHRYFFQRSCFRLHHSTVFFWTVSEGIQMMTIFLLWWFIFSIFWSFCSSSCECI